MKRSGYRTIFHIYLLFFLSLSGAVLLAGYLFFLTITIQTPDGRILRSDWPRTYTEHFQEQILFTGGAPKLTQAGMAQLQDYGIGIQILDASGFEVFSYQKPEHGNTAYSSVELLRLYETGRTEGSGTTAFAGSISNQGNSYAYVLYFPEHVSKITMYVNGERFTGGKMVILPILAALLLLILAAGVLYGLFTTNAIKRLTASVEEIAHRRYLPVQNHGVFHDLYDGLNTLDEEIRASDRLQAQTEKMREEWIANITHDLKTPLSPIRGYGEILYEADGKSGEECRRYGGILLKNVSYMETLIDDLKLTYQLDGGMFPLNREDGNLIRFLRELVIDILNTPEYENRVIHFESEADSLSFSFDRTLFTRSFRNLIINAFAHGEEDTEVTLRVFAADELLEILVADDGAGMKPETVEHLFERYYRGADTGQKPEGTGLGLAIVKGIVELHGGSISVTSAPAAGTSFRITFPLR